ncbi:hypothetical protein V5034_23410, partial [Enterobacter kobei]
MTASDIKPIDLVVVNLYPCQETIQKSGVTVEEAIENIQAGGRLRYLVRSHEHGDVYKRELFAGAQDASLGTDGI